MFFSLIQLNGFYNRCNRSTIDGNMRMLRGFLNPQKMKIGFKMLKTEWVMVILDIWLA